MKKFLSILLTLSIICSLVVVPAMSVSAAETVLFKEAESVTAIDYSDLAAVTEEEFTNGSISSGKGSVTMTASKGAASVTKVDDSTINAKLTMQTTSGAAVLDFIPETVSTDAVKNVMTFKFKPSYLEADGSKAYSNNYDSPSYIRFSSIGVKADGSKVYHRATQWNTAKQKSVTDATTGEVTITTAEAAFSRGAGAGANGYSEGQFTADDEGYYYIKLVSYVNSSGQQVAQSYDMNENGAAKGYHSYSSTNDNYVATLGHGFRFDYSTSSKDSNCILSADIKDINMWYEYDAIGSVTTAGSAQYSYNDAEDTYYITNKPASGASGHRVVFKVPSTLTEGRVVTDFSIKNESPVVNETGTNSSVKQIVTGSGTVIGAFDMATSTKVGAWNASNDGYSPDTGYRTYETAKLEMTCVDGWSDLRIVAMCNSEGKWTYALYDRNKSLTRPIYLRVTTDTKYSGIGFGYYLYGDGRNASTADSTLPKVSIPITMKNVSIYTQDTCGIETNITRTGLSPSGAPYTVKTDTTGIRFDGVVHVQTPTTATAKFVVYDSETDCEITSVTKELISGIYLYNSSNVFGVTDLEDNTNVYAKLYIKNGSDEYCVANNVVGSGKYVLANTSFESEAAYGYAAEGDELRTLRFYFTPSFKTTMGVTNFGAYIVPLGIFDEGDVTSSSAELVTATGADVDPSTLVSGEVFAVELNGVPTEYEDVTVIGIPFIAIDGEYVWGDRFDVVPASLLQ